LIKTDNLPSFGSICQERSLKKIALILIGNNGTVFAIFEILSFNLGFSWHEICPLARVAILIKEFLANQGAHSQKVGRKIRIGYQVVD
jgi:hypothetical protein